MPRLAISSRFNLSVDDDHPLASVIDEVLRTIDGLHGITVEVPRIRLRTGSKPETVDFGVYRRTRNGAPVEIVLADFATQPALTLVHEIGHYLDHQAIDEPGVFASES